MDPQQLQSLVSERLWYSAKLIFMLSSVAGTPVGVTASKIDFNSVLVSWTAPSPSPGYEVFYQTTAASSRVSGGNTSNTELTLTGLTLGETYSFIVVAFGAPGAPVLPSAHSNTANITLSKL